MKLKTLIFFIIITTLLCCNKSPDFEKSQKQRDNIVSVKDNITEIKTDLIFGNSLLYIFDKYLIINEISPEGEKGLHILDKDSFKYITSSGTIGKGPGEIIIPGRIGIDYKNRVLWVPDHGKKVMFKFPMDSILNNTNFLPTLKIDLNNEVFIARFDFVNDTIAIGKAVRVLSNSSFEMAMSKINFRNNQVEMYGYEHPETIGRFKSNSLFKLSLANNIYVNCYGAYDLMTICDLEGNLKFNVYGRDGLENKDFRKSYYSGVDFYKKYIITSYIGDIGIVSEKNREPKGNTPSKFLVFDLEGNYIKTLELDEKFTYFCVDEENKRLIIYFQERENPLGYIDLNLN